MKTPSICVEEAIFSRVNLLLTALSQVEHSTFCLFNILRSTCIDTILVPSMDRIRTIPHMLVLVFEMRLYS